MDKKNSDPAVNIALPSLPKEIEDLSLIALNLWWTWNLRGKNLFKMINPYLWKESGHNPIALLKNLSNKSLQKLSKDEEFIREYKYVRAVFRDYMERKSGEYDSFSVAYFCAEYGLHHSLPIYSGGLGFLAGDILKEASDMNLPMVGIGFMYPKGYVRQIIGEDGWQRGTNEEIDKDIAPIERVLDSNGNHFTIKVPFIEPAVFASVWRVNVGKTSLYLLDTDIDKNDPWDREISYRLYTPDMHQRLRQQIVLGIGGYKVLEELNIKYSILHLNEGHSSFALFERMRYFIENMGMSKDEALKAVRESSVFTTHTPLQSATDIYGFDLIGSYFSDYAKRLGMSKEEFMSFGVYQKSSSSGFNMSVLAFNMCNYRNAVSKKHSEVTKNIWKELFEKQNRGIEYVTNGVHLSSWIGDELYYLLEKVLGDNWSEIQDDKDIWEIVEKIEDKELWDIHYLNKVRMVNFIRERVRKKWAKEGIEPLVAMAEGVMLDPDVLTIGFARRMTSYKRPSLILYDLDRLEKIVNNSARPVQIIFAGKAHPADNPGKMIIQKIFKTAQDKRFGGRIAFIEDYGEEVAKYLVKGVDVWLNNPLLPMEACGTSGMKASVNGVLHLSVKDGWWPEGYNGKNGWSFGGEKSDDEKDAYALYDLLEKEIIPLYYDTDENRIPIGWVKKMKEAIKSIAPSFSSRRMMKEYLRKFYIPISQKYK